MSFDRSDRTFLRNLIAGAVDEIVAEVTAAIDEIVADDADDPDVDDPDVDSPDADSDADTPAACPEDEDEDEPKDDGHVAVPTHTVAAARQLAGKRCVVVGIVEAPRAVSGRVTYFEMHDPGVRQTFVQVSAHHHPVVPQPQLPAGAIVAVDGVARYGEIVPQTIRVLAAPAPESTPLDYIRHRSGVIPSEPPPKSWPPKHDLPKQADVVACRPGCIGDRHAVIPTYTAFLTTDGRKLYMQCQHHGNWVRYDAETITAARDHVALNAHTDYQIGAACPGEAIELACCRSNAWTVARNGCDLRLICAARAHARDVKVEANGVITVYPPTAAT